MGAHLKIQILRPFHHAPTWIAQALQIRETLEDRPTEGLIQLREGIALTPWAGIGNESLQTRTLDVELAALVRDHQIVPLDHAIPLAIHELFITAILADSLDGRPLGHWVGQRGPLRLFLKIHPYPIIERLLNVRCLGLGIRLHEQWPRAGIRGAVIRLGHLDRDGLASSIPH